MPTAERFACGTRARYVTGCRCEPCTVANLARYHARQKAIADAAAGVQPSGPAGVGVVLRAGVEHRVKTCPGANAATCVAGGAWLRRGGAVCQRCLERATVFDGLVSAERARQHLVALSAAGVGKRAVAASSDVALTVISEIRQGLKKQIRAATERRILAVDAGAIADHAIVSAKEALAAVRLMRRAGYTKGEIAQRLGAQTPALQIALKGRMLARTRLAVERLAREVAAELAAEKALADVCGTCGYSHDPANRLRLISRMVEGGATAGEVIEEWSCFYGGGLAGKRLGYRDVAQLIRQRGVVAA